MNMILGFIYKKYYLWQMVIDIKLYSGTNLPATLLVTREAAMKITEKAISSALGLLYN